MLNELNMQKPTYNWDGINAEVNANFQALCDSARDSKLASAEVHIAALLGGCAKALVGIGFELAALRTQLARKAD